MDSFFPFPKRFAPSGYFESGGMDSEENPEDGSSERLVGPGFLTLPPEIHAKILMMLDPTDVLSYASTCQTCNIYAETQQIW